MKVLVKKEITMTSLEIAEYTGKLHKHINRDIRNMLGELGKDRSNFEHIFKDSYGRDQTGFILPKKEVLCLVSGYSIKLRMAIIDRLEELENQVPALPDFTNPAAAARAYADQWEKNEKLSIENARQSVKILTDKPMVEFAKTVEGTNKTISIGAMAKLSGLIGRNTLFNRLRDNKILIPFGRERNKPYQRFLSSGYFEVSETIVKRTNGDQITFTTSVTGKGQVWLMKKIKEWTTE